MASMEGTSKKCLDDSLTNIQWLCELESSELLLAKKTARTNDPMPTQTAAPHSPNPYPRPPYSYATLILLAINSTEDKRMTLQEIYKWIEDHYPYYTKCKKAWKNSIRHNLSLHSFFLKEKRPAELPGKGSYWSISPEGKENIMREVIKHAHPMVQSSFGAGQGLRHILPKPTDADEMTQSTVIPKICSIASNGNVMPVVVLPTNLYMSLASKIASGNVKGSIAPFGTTGNAQGSSQIQTDMQNQTNVHSDNSTNVNALMNEILNDENFSQVLDSLKKEDESVSDEMSISGNQCSVELSSTEENKENIKTPSRKHKHGDNNNPGREVEPKRTKSEDPAEEYIFVKPSTQPRKSTPVRQLMSRSPLRERNQPTLAAINNQHDFMTNDKDFRFQELSQLMLSPVCVSSSAHGSASTKTSTPTASSPLACFRSGLTPLKYDSDSGFFTPLKDSDFDYLLSPNQLDFGITPAKSTSCTPQKCRKSLRLGTLVEEEDENDAMPWMQI